MAHNGERVAVALPDRTWVQSPAAQQNQSTDTGLLVKESTVFIFWVPSKENWLLVFRRL